jgi:glycosyltransferase involved in cell wall biosynthesis
MSLRSYFDAVVILSWSDWATEPRSNRYHYATRFAKHLPVLFIQNQRLIAGEIIVTESGIENLDIVACSAAIDRTQINDLLTLMRHRGFKQPLVWIYDYANYWPLLDELPRYFRVYHATEDYFLMHEKDDAHHKLLRQRLKKLLGEIELVVAVTEGVQDNIVSQGGYCGAMVLSENGCDYSFYARFSQENRAQAAEAKSVVVFQGGVNQRLDYQLLYSVAQKMPDFEFRFLGRIVESEGVQRLKSLDNVTLLGPVQPDALAKEMIGAMVGIVPFVQTELMKVSLPLKVYEYIACGLPIVSIPIRALESIERMGGIVRFATKDDEFVAAIRAIGLTRHDPMHLARRDELARSNSYDIRFKAVVAAILDKASAQFNNPLPLNIALLYDAASCHVGTVKEHLNSFRRHSEHSYTLLPVTGALEKANVRDVGNSIDFSVFDCVVLHYSVRISLQFHFAEVFANALEKFRGLKVLFIQDEYDSVECTRQWMDRLAFDLVYTCVPLAEREKVYPSSRYPATTFLPTLTGYIPDLANIDRFIIPLAERKLFFVYRGRELSPLYGRLGREKYTIGIEAQRRAKEMKLPVDIASDSASRIYGEEWYRFLGSGRATLGTESGSSVFDFDGTLTTEIEALRTKHPEMPFDEIWELIVKVHDGYIHMNQVSPKIFEAIRLKTGLVLFEGEYSDVVKPNIHFIPLKKDFSNFADVVAKVMDDDLMQEMTNRAYMDVIVSGKFSYRSFVDEIDRDIRERCLRRKRRAQMYGAIYAIDDDVARRILPFVPLDLPCGADIFDNVRSLEQINKALMPLYSSNDRSVIVQASAWVGEALNKFATLIVKMGCRDVVMKNPIVFKIARSLYRLLPKRIQIEVIKNFNRS